MFKMKQADLMSQPTVKAKSFRDGFSGTLQETAEYFAENNVDIFQGFRDILIDPTYYENYTARLSEGADEFEADEMSQLFMNSRENILREATFEQITPLQSLSMPIIRKMWAKTSMKNAISTEVAKLPTFVIAYQLPYLKDPNGEKHYLPEVLYGANSRVEKPRLYAEYVPMTVFNNASGSDNILTRTVIGGVPASTLANDAIDSVLYIESIKINVPGDGGTTVSKEVKVMGKMSFDSKFYILINTVSAHTLPADQVAVHDVLLGHMNCSTGEYSLASVRGLVTDFKFYGYLTQDANTRVDTVGFEVKKKEINIPHGPHIDAPIPIETLQDAMALFNLDATVTIIDIMSQTMSQKIDAKIREFLIDSFEKTKAGQAYPMGGYAFEGTFDAQPSSGFAGTPTQWRDELKTIIEWWANKLKHHTKFTQGYFVVIGNPVDVQLISDIDWQFSGNNPQKGGVNIDYNVGVLTSHNSFNFVASDLLPQGKLRMIFLPNVNDYMTYKYYAYTFNIQKDYRSNQMSLVPNIMMTKRDQIEEFIPMQVVINILHNTGSSYDSYLTRA